MPAALFGAIALGLVLYERALHAHVCPVDGTRWTHTRWHLDSTKAHTCATCGLVWRWIAGPLDCPLMEASRQADVERARRGEAPRYDVEHAH